MKNISLKILAVVSILILFFGGFTNTVSYATKNEDALNSVDNKIKDAKNEMQQVNANQSTTMSQLRKLSAKIAETETEVRRLDREIKDLEKKITKTENEITEKQEQYDENYEKFTTRLVASYQAGETTYLDVLLASENISDVLSNWFYLSEIAKADKAFQDSLQKQKSDLEDVKIGLNKDKNLIEKNKDTIKREKQALLESKVVKDEYMSKLTKDEKKIQAELDQYEKDKKAIQKRIEEEASKYSVSNQSPNKYGYISPLKGRTTNDIYCGWYGYPGHTGVDFSYWGINGETIYAVKSGVVFISDALRWSNGAYRSFGEYIVIDHLDGSMTLYAHGISGSRKVKEGQHVSQGQAIMKVGSTGNSTGPHLHFEVHINGRKVNPTPYLP